MDRKQLADAIDAVQSHSEPQSPARTGSSLVGVARADAVLAEPNMAWPAAPMSAPRSDVLDPSPSLASTADADLRKEAEERPRIEAAEAEAAASILLRAYGEWKDHKFPLCHESRSDYEQVLMRAGPVLAHYVLATRPRPAPQPATGDAPATAIGTTVREEVRRGE